eukprot:1141746-Rhodomonas_salina.2
MWDDDIPAPTLHIAAVLEDHTVRSDDVDPTLSFWLLIPVPNAEPNNVTPTEPVEGKFVVLDKKKSVWSHHVGSSNKHEPSAMLCWMCVSKSKLTCSVTLPDTIPTVTTTPRLDPEPPRRIPCTTLSEIQVLASDLV